MLKNVENSGGNWLSNPHPWTNNVFDDPVWLQWIKWLTWTASILQYITSTKMTFLEKCWMHLYDIGTSFKELHGWHRQQWFYNTLLGARWSSWKTNYCFCLARGLRNKISIHEVINLVLKLLLTYSGRVTHICVSKLSILGSDNGLSPGRRQAII